jgi:hypothetical protein
MNTGHASPKFQVNQARFPNLGLSHKATFLRPLTGYVVRANLIRIYPLPVLSRRKIYNQNNLKTSKSKCSLNRQCHKNRLIAGVMVVLRFFVP